MAGKQKTNTNKKADCTPPVSVVRRDDLLALTFEFKNLRLAEDSQRLVLIDANKPAYVIVHFPPQHLAERAYEGLPSQALPWPPIPSRLSGPSRLAFRLKGNADSIGFNLHSLLDWSNRGDLEPSLVDPTRRKQEITEPESTQTAIEAPYRLILSPAWTSEWQGMTEPLSLGKPEGPMRSELWHTRLIGRVLDESGEKSPVEVRAVWSPDYQLEDPKQAQVAFAMPLRAHYTDLINRTHRKDLDPEPVPAHNLMLSALGAWLDLDGPLLPGPASVRLDRWTHITTMGQDELVVTEEKGFLLPTAHAASLVTITRRRFDVPQSDASETAPPEPQRGAFLRTRFFIKVRTPVSDLGRDPRMPFTSIELLDRITPDLYLDDPQAISFWITVGDEAPRNYLFQACGRDWADQQSGFEFPAMFLSAAATADQVKEAADRYRQAQEERVVLLQGQLVSVAEPLKPIDGETAMTVITTRLELLKLRLLAEPRSEQNSRDPSAPFGPVAESLLARLPILKDFLADDINQDWFELVDLNQDGNVGEVFLKHADINAEPIRLDFADQAAKIGALIAPSMQIAGVARSVGPFGDIAPLFGQDFSPARYFLQADSLLATILGGIPLAQVLTTIPAPELSVLPHFSLRAGAVDGREGRQLSLAWKTRELQADEKRVFVPGHQCELDLRVDMRARPGQEPEISTRARLTDYELHLLLLGDNAVVFQFDYMEYIAGAGQQAALHMELASIRMQGDLLKVVQFLAEASAASFKAKGKESGLSFSVTFSIKAIELALAWGKKRDKEAKKDDPEAGDAIPYGPTLLLYNIGFSFGVTIPLSAKPVVFKLALASPNKPFFIGSRGSIWGGGGSFAATVDTQAVAELALSLQFGAQQAFKAGSAKCSCMATAGVLLTYRFDTKGLDFAFILTFAGSAKLTDWFEVAVGFYVELKPVGAVDFEGEAKLSFKLTIAFFTLSISHKFQFMMPGPNLGTPKLLSGDAYPSAAGFPELMDIQTWQTYRNAFAA